LTEEITRKESGGEVERNRGDCRGITIPSTRNIEITTLSIGDTKIHATLKFLNPSSDFATKNYNGFGGTQN